MLPGKKIWLLTLARKRLRVLVALTLAGLALRVWGLDTGLPHASVPAEGETLRVVLGNLLSPLLLDGNMGLNPQEWSRPSFYYYALSLLYGGAYALGHLLGGLEDWLAVMGGWAQNPTPFHLLLRVFSVVCGTALIPLAYRLGRYFQRPTMSLVYAGLVAGCYLLVRTSHWGLPQTMTSLLTLLALMLLVRYERKRSEASLLAACVAVGLALASDYLALALLPALWVCLLKPYWQTDCQDDHIDWKAFSVALWKPTAIVLGVFLLVSPWALLDSQAFGQGVQAFFLQRYSMLTPWTGWRFYPGFALFYGLGGWALAMSLLGLYRSGRRLGIPLDWGHVTLWSFLLMQGLMLGMQTVPKTMDSLSLAVVLLFYAALGVDYLASLIKRSLGEVRSAHRWGATLPLAALILLASYQPLAMSIGFDRLIAQPDTRRLVAEQIERQIPPQTALASGPRIGRLHLSPERYPQLLVETGLSTPETDEVQIAPFAPNVQISSSYAYPEMFRDLGIRWVVLYDELLPYSNSVQEWQAVQQEGTVVFQAAPQKTGVFDWQVDLNEPWYEPFVPIYVPFKAFEHYERPGPLVVVFDLGPDTRPPAEHAH